MKVLRLNLFHHVFVNHEEDQLQLNDDMKLFHQILFLYHVFYSVDLINFEAILVLLFHHTLIFHQ